MGAACPSAGVAALNGSFVEFDGSGALGQERTFTSVCLQPAVVMVAHFLTVDP